MVCVNTYSLVKRVCVGHSSYILSAVGEGGDDEDYEREAPPPSDKDGCDWDGLSASFMT